MVLFDFSKVAPMGFPTGRESFRRGSEKVSEGGRKKFPEGCGKSFRVGSERLYGAVGKTLRCSLTVLVDYFQPYL